MGSKVWKRMATGAAALVAMFTISGCTVSLDGICPVCDGPPPPPPPLTNVDPPIAPPDPCRDRVALYGVHFDFDKATLRPGGQDVLDSLVTSLSKCPATQIRIEGHTDAVGSDGYNQGLSERRAAAVVDYLVDHGLSRSVLSSVGLGESRPMDTNDTEAGRARNRRVEVTPVN